MKLDCYIGRMPCGCVVAVAIDDPQFKKHTAKSVADFIKEGYSVEHVNWDSVKHEFGSCKCSKKDKSK